MPASRLSRSARRRRRVLLLAAATVLAIGAALALGALGVTRSVEDAAVDARFAVRGEQAPPPDVTVVGIDDRTFDGADSGGLGLRWPFPRGVHARVIDRLSAAGASVIAYDVQFTEASPPGQEDEDVRLLEAIARATERGTRVVLATSEVRADGATRVLGGPETQRAVGAQVGNAVTPGDDGAVVRRLWPEHDGLRSFALVAAEAQRGRPVPAADIPRDGAWIDFPGPPGTVETVSFADVARGRVADEALRGRVVVVGATAPSLQDSAPTSVSGDREMPGPELQAGAVATVLGGFPLRSPAPGVAILLLVGFALVPPVLGIARMPVARRRLPPLAGFAIAIALGLLYLLLAQWLFEQGTVAPVAAPLLGLSLSAVATLAVLVLVEASDRRRIHDLFARFVPEQVVDEVVANADEELRLGGEQRVATVLFSDLRGFTTYSESRPPGEVIDVLNAYLGEMTDAILDAGGTLVAYLGDGIMAVFGAPLEQPDHADRALSAAREMLARLERFNEASAERREQPFRMGIGLNTGQIVSGNVGSERRLEYTTIGDTVNTASRIEGMTKGTPYALLLAASTVEALSERPGDLVFVDAMEIRGRATSVELWGLAGAAGAPGAPVAAAPAGEGA